MSEEKTSVATFGGGCFWCTEALFQQLNGVMSVESGYSGGELDSPTYQQVCSGSTGHAEVIQVTYDSRVITFAELVYVHLVTHNPTTRNQQGADKGTQYRSIIFYRSDEEREIADKIIEELQTQMADGIVTELAPFEKFYLAEEHHQNYYESNENAPYCQGVIQPKLDKFRELFSKKVK